MKKLKPTKTKEAAGTVKALHSGWEVTFGDPDVDEKRKCITCGDKMKATKGCYGATSWAESMAGRKHKYTRYECPNAGQPWHRQVIALKKLMRDTPSATIHDMLAEEVVGIIQTREPTKDHFDGLV